MKKSCLLNIELKNFDNLNPIELALLYFIGMVKRYDLTVDRELYWGMDSDAGDYSAAFKTKMFFIISNGKEENSTIKKLGQNKEEKKINNTAFITSEFNNKTNYIQSFYHAINNYMDALETDTIKLNDEKNLLGILTNIEFISPQRNINNGTGVLGNRKIDFVTPYRFNLEEFITKIKILSETEKLEQSIEHIGRKNRLQKNIKI